MTAPKFFVVARVVGRNGAHAFWRDRLVNLCAVSATEPYGDSYYWGYDVDGEPDTTWGLEGYTHPIGFFIDHVSSDIFKQEMALVDKDELLRTEQGLKSPDYDLHHYDQVSGYLKRPDDLERDSKTSYVAVYHFWSKTPNERAAVLERLSRFASETLKAPGSVQSALVLKECRDLSMATLWLRVKSEKDWKLLKDPASAITILTSDLEPMCSSIELHQSQSFNGHLGLKD